MLKIYTSEKIAKQSSKLEVIPDIDNRFSILLEESADNIDNIFNDTLSNHILVSIEGMTQRLSNGWITAKFGDVRLNDISTGGKALLIIAAYSDNCIINIDELGYNCIDILFDIAKTRDIEVISTRVLNHIKDYMQAEVNGVLCRGIDITISMGEHV